MKKLLPLAALLALSSAFGADGVTKKYISSTNKVNGLPEVFLGRVVHSDGSMTSTSFMERDPEYVPSYFDSVQNKTYNVLFANGRPIVVEKTPNQTGYNRVSWFRYLPSSNRPYIDIPTTDLVIVGGANGRGQEHPNVANTSVTMNGGECRTIFGGNLGNGTVGSANIAVNAGSKVDVIYGGSAGMSFNSTVGLPRYGDLNTSFLTNQYSKVPKCFVGSVKISINMASDDEPIVAVFGGGFAVSDVGSVDIRMTGGSVKYRGSSIWHITNQRATMCPGSSSGIVGLANFTLFGGYCDMVQSWSRGYTAGAEIAIKGGIVNNLYAGGDTTESASEGRVSTAVGGWTTLDIVGGTVTNLLSGYNERVTNLSKVGGFYAYDVIVNGDPASFNLKSSGSLDKATLLGNEEEEFSGLGFIQRRRATDAEVGWMTNCVTGVSTNQGIVDTDAILLLRNGFDKIATTNTTLQAVLDRIDARLTSLEMIASGTNPVPRIAILSGTTTNDVTVSGGALVVTPRGD